MLKGLGSEVIEAAVGLSALIWALRLHWLVIRATVADMLCVQRLVSFVRGDEEVHEGLVCLFISRPLAAWTQL